MSQSFVDSAVSKPKPTGKVQNVILWLLQIGTAIMFIMAAIPKFMGAEEAVAVFNAVGIGQWFRYVTGALETIGAIALLIPALAGPGALLLACVMLGAIASHLFIIGGSPLLAIVLLVVVAIIAWGRRDTITRLFAR